MDIPGDIAGTCPRRVLALLPLVLALRKMFDDGLSPLQWPTTLLQGLGCPWKPTTMEWVEAQVSSTSATTSRPPATARRPRRPSPRALKAPTSSLAWLLQPQRCRDRLTTTVLDRVVADCQYLPDRTLSRHRAPPTRHRTLVHCHPDSQQLSPRIAVSSLAQRAPYSHMAGESLSPFARPVRSKGPARAPGPVAPLGRPLRLPFARSGAREKLRSPCARAR